MTVDLFNAVDLHNNILQHSSLNRSGMTCDNEGSYSFTCHPHI